MTKVKIDLEGNKPEVDYFEATIEQGKIEQLGVDGIRGIGETWEQYSSRTDDPDTLKKEREKLKEARLKALKESTKTPV